METENYKILKKKFEIEFKTDEQKEKYLNILSDRISENVKSLNRLFFVMVLTLFAYPLLINSVVTEFTIGSIKFKDLSVGIAIVPTLFTLSYYRWRTVWFDLENQKDSYRALVVLLFKLNESSDLQENLIHYSIPNSINKIHLVEKSKGLRRLVAAIWLPLLFIVGFFIPYGFIYYSFQMNYRYFGLDDFYDWFILGIPLLITLLTVLLTVQDIKKKNERKRSISKSL